MRKEHAEVATECLQLLLRQAKLATMGIIYERLEPGADGRIRTVLSPVGTETGRFNSAETFLEASTNLQNLPKKTAKLDPLYDVRRCVVPAPGHVFVEVDLSQAEARAVAAYAKDQATLELFASGADIHRHTAARIFGVELAAVTPLQRELGKRARHALNYGMGWSLFHSDINKDADLTGIAISAPLAKTIHAGYHRDNPLLLKWWRSLEAEVHRCRYLTNCYGRRRYFYAPEPRMTDIAAYLPQSTIADMLNNSLVAYYEQALALRLPLPALQIHDAILLEVPELRAMDAVRVLREVCTGNVDVAGVPLHVPADVSIGHSWASMKKVEA